MAGGMRFAGQQRVALPGSEKQAFAAAAKQGAGREKAAGAAGRMGQVQVTVALKAKAPVVQAAGKANKLPERLTRAAFARRHGAAAESVRLLRAFAKEFGLIAGTPGKPGPGLVQMSGSAAAMQRAFGVTLRQQATAEGMLRLREGAIFLPEELAGHVLAVMGLDNRPQAKAHFRVAKKAANNVSYTPPQVAELYGFPLAGGAAGQTIGLIELGGGYRAADVKAYFKSLGIAAPKVTAIGVDKGKNTPGNANGADGEVMLDIEVAGSVAPGAKLVVYFAPNTDQGFLDAITTAVHDRVHAPSVISISWGGPESSWTGQAIAAMDAACQAAAALGVTITVAAGDGGSSDGGTGNNVDFPASSPHVLACGGTKLVAAGGTLVSEVVWNETASGEGATGGGVSTVFALPAWQASAGVPAGGAAGGRGVPDVAGNADPATGYQVRVDGQNLVIGGTSAVAPLWAGLIALANQANGRPAGFVNPPLYAAGAAKAFRDITVGNNGAFQAGPGWDACTGLGSPVGTAVVQALGKGAAKKAKKGAGR